MKYLLLNLLACSLVLIACSAALAQAPMLMENPTVSRTQIAFSYAGDIWVVPLAGGEARPIARTPARELFPVFSPDGSEIAFARFNPATGPMGWDVFVASASGGGERRITYHPDVDIPVNWTPDGKNLVFMSYRYTTGPVTHLFTVPAQGGFATEVPVPRGCSRSPIFIGHFLSYCG